MRLRYKAQREIIPVFTENHMKSINTPSGNMQNFWSLKQMVHIVRSGLNDISDIANASAEEDDSHKNDR
jgi:hypothetical protein